jgi:hypothetical protein
MKKQCVKCKLEFIDSSRNTSALFCSKQCKNKHWYIKNRERVIQRCRAYELENSDKIRERKRRYVKNRRDSDVNFRIAFNIRARVSRALSLNFKKTSTIKSLGCSIEQLKKYLESQFQPGMSWNNYGKWHIDHIRPLSSFDLTCVKQFKQACHHANLQPLWARDNLCKGSKYE